LEKSVKMKLVYSGVFVLVLLAIVACLSWRPVLLAIGDVLVVQDELVPADVIHVVSGPNYRVDHSIQLYQQGYGKQLFLTGRGRQAGDHKRRAIRQGVPPEAITADGSAVTSTYSEALRLQAFIAQSETPVRSVIVSSDAYHMRRARWAYRRVLGDQVQVQMSPVPFESSPFRHEWWTHRRSFQRVVEEYVKLAYYCARYKVFRGPIREWLASLDRN
jgi:uncharacterized SAM-binding protein YcdF (DUF218 family)